MPLLPTIYCENSQKTQNYSYNKTSISTVVSSGHVCITELFCLAFSTSSAFSFTTKYTLKLLSRQPKDLREEDIHIRGLGGK